MGDITPRASQWLAAGSAQLPLLTPRPRPLPRPRGCFAKMGGGGEGEARLEICYFLKIRMCAQMRRSPGGSGAEPCTAAGRASPGRVRRPFVPGPLEAGPRRPSRRARPGGAHSRARAAGAGSGRVPPGAPPGVQLLPGPRARARRGAPRAPADGRWRFNTAPPGTWARRSFPFSLSPRQRDPRKAREASRSLPCLHFLFGPFSPCFPSSVASGDAAGPLGCALPRASRPRPRPE